MCRFSEDPGDGARYPAVLLLHLFLLSAVAPAEVPPAPDLSLSPTPGGDWQALCRAPPGQTGQTFLLFRDKQQVDVMEFPNEEQPVAQFTLGARPAELQGHYCCQYQTQRAGVLEFSVMSRYQFLAPHDSLVVPSLVLLSWASDTGDSVTVECVGSASYPGAQFTLFLMGSALPKRSFNALATQHTARFTLPAPLQPGGSNYECQYSYLVGQERRHSPRSPPLHIRPAGRTFSTDPTSPSSPTDWPLIAGSVSASLLFVMILAVLGVLLYRKVKRAAEEKRKREQERLWNHLHTMDNIVGLGHDGLGHGHW
ncbi:alpha-1B-glycoprotein isoform X2 [Amia ocellicauda]|uniref:alpha-1B-glycoprotein isoform X2 n=1 Tax=Amia ocellicauda TaxID=2972642 RepID=UPI003464C656